MLNYVWVGLIIAGFVFGAVNGRMEEVTNAAIQSAGKAVELAIGLLGVMCLWNGIMGIAEKGGMIRLIARLVRPAFRVLFPQIPKNHAAIGAIVMNLAANFLGLGNAATPLGLKAMHELQRLNAKKDTASDSMCMFLVLNTAAIQLIPATVIAIRADANSAKPAEIMVTVWIASICATLTGIIAAKAMSGLGWKGKTPAPSGASPGRHRDRGRSS